MTLPLLLLILLAPPTQAEFKTFKRSLTTTKTFGRLGQPKVELYATAWCGYCKQARAYLKARSIPFADYDIEKDAGAAKRYNDLGGGGVPLARIGDQTVRGFSPDLYAPLLK